jgi:riboflavin synthase|tara:strand:+ start:13907 stop:14485 length:579 start_codon:yes stop_codon:yes gene_type:complete
MFTGIIEQMGEVVALVKEQDNLHISVKADFTHELKIDQSVAHNGICLTVVAIDKDVYTVTAIKETLDKTNLAKLEKGHKVNLERCMKLGDRLDGHIVQGHVDQTAVCSKIGQENGWHTYTFEHQLSDHFTVEKGSVCVNGVSLTVVNSQANSFSVAIIPYTYEHTNFHSFKEGDLVNIEFDIIGKYITKMNR